MERRSHLTRKIPAGLRLLSDQSQPKLSKTKRLNWSRIFDASDIGAERRLIANKFVPPSSSALDVGCGRGFFSFACARNANRVTSLDLMDGLGRSGWWQEFRNSAELLNVSKKIYGVRASATSMPFCGGCFDLVASVHAIRNFGSRKEIRLSLPEALRTLRRGGRIVLVESDLEDERYSGYAAVYSLRVKMGWELKLPPFRQIEKWVRDAGFTRVSTQSVDTGLKYAPLFFRFDHATMRGMEKAYRRALALYDSEGRGHPPIVIVDAVKP